MIDILKTVDMKKGEEKVKLVLYRESSGTYMYSSDRHYFTGTSLRRMRNEYPAGSLHSQAVLTFLSRVAGFEKRGFSVVEKKR